MEPFSVRVELTKREFTTLFLLQSLKHPIMIIGTFVLILLSVGIFVYSESYQSVIDTVTFKMALFLVLAWPAYAVYNSLITYKRNPTLVHGVTYNISNAGINGVTIGQNTNIEWAKIVKRIERHGMIFLYSGKRVVYIIPIKNLTPLQIKSIREKTPEKK